MIDKKIVNLLWNRDEDAIRLMEEHYGSYCRQISYRIVKNQEDASDCLNDTWFQIWKSIPPNKPNNLRAYAAKIIRNISLNLVTHNQAFRRGSGNVPLVFEELEEMLGGEDPVEHMIDKREFTELLNIFLGKLEKREREIFVLRFWYFWDIKDIAGKYGIKEKAVSNTVYRLKKQFRSYWEVQIRQRGMRA